MATLAQHVPAIGASDSRRAVAAGSSTFWQKILAEAIFILGLVATCVAVIALRMAVAPTVLIPRDIAFSGVGVATLAAVAAFTGAALLRKHVVVEG